MNRRPPLNLFMVSVQRLPQRPQFEADAECSNLSSSSKEINFDFPNVCEADNEIRLDFSNVCEADNA
jgi:hypothetical protein